MATPPRQREVKIKGLRAFEYGSPVKVIKPDGTVAIQEATYWGRIPKKKLRRHTP